MIQTDIDIGTNVRYNGRTGILIYNRCRQGNEVVCIEFDSDDNSHQIKQLNVNDLEIKYGGEGWQKVSDIKKK